MSLGQQVLVMNVSLQPTLAIHKAIQVLPEDLSKKNCNTNRLLLKQQYKRNFEKNPWIFCEKHNDGKCSRTDNSADF